MITRQVIGALLFGIALQKVACVINGSTTKATEGISDKKDGTERSNTINGAKIQDSVAASSDQEIGRRKTPTYAAPTSIEETYLVLPNKPNLPIHAPVSYPLPSLDIPPPVAPLSLFPWNYGPTLPQVYGPPLQIQQNYAQPFQQNFAQPIQQIYTSSPQQLYSLPLKSSKPLNLLKNPKQSYGLPQSHVPQRPVLQNQLPGKIPKPVYGPPSKHFKFPKPILHSQKLNGPLKPLYAPPKPGDFIQPSNAYGPPTSYISTSITPPKDVRSVPLNSYSFPGKTIELTNHIHKAPVLQHRPEPVVHGPPHPGVGAPPTPPDIKYDGWQPIPGLVSKPPSSYGTPNVQKHNDVDLNSNSDFVPPPLSPAPPSSPGHSSTQPFSDSYTAPLNAVTGSGGVVSSSGHHLTPEDGDDITLSLGLSTLGIHGDRESLSVIKSIDYDLSQFGNLYNVHTFQQPFQSPHGAAIGGLTPPSGSYGVPFSGQYGAPPLPSPKQPIPFREPVPQGLLESIGKNSAQKGTYDVTEKPYSNINAGSSYIPPPIPDITSTNKEPQLPSSLYSLPPETQPVQFHISANTLGNSADNYLTPPGITPSAYQLQNYNLLSTFENIPVAYDLASSVQGHIPISTFSHGPQQGSLDCNIHGSHLDPSAITLQVPNQNSYQPFHSNEPAYGAGNEDIPDLEIALSQKTKSVSSSPNNLIEPKKQSEKVTGKSLAKDFKGNAELTKSQALDLNNIPVKGSLGTYSLSIQPADGSAALKSLPHNQILNEGLLQSILNAIEQPQYNGVGAINQQTENIETLMQNSPQQQDDVETQGSVKSHTVLEAAKLNGTGTSTLGAVETSTKDSESSLEILNNNEIALYFSNNAERHNMQKQLQENQNKNTDVSEKQNISYVSFKTPASSYSYGDINVLNSTSTQVLENQ